MTEPPKEFLGFVKAPKNIVAMSKDVLVWFAVINASEPR